LETGKRGGSPEERGSDRIEECRGRKEGRTDRRSKSSRKKLGFPHRERKTEEMKWTWRREEEDEKRAGKKKKGREGNWRENGRFHTGADVSAFTHATFFWPFSFLFLCRSSLHLAVGVYLRILKRRFENSEEKI
jgi:hypothetical protein